MRILAIGDFNGRFPKKYEKIIKKERIDVVVVDGDYPPFSLKKEFFRYVYGSSELNLWDFIGKKRYRKGVVNDFRAAESVMKKLNKLSVPVISVLGNHDIKLNDDSMDVSREERKNTWAWAYKNYNRVVDLFKKYKHIRVFYYKAVKIKDYIFIGAGGASFPGHVKSRAYKKHKAKLERLFKKYNKENKEGKVIFVSHNSPYNTKLDLIASRGTHEDVCGKHYGSKMVKRVIEKYQPILSLSGHIDEGLGKQKIGRTLAINSGPVHLGRGSIVEIIERRVKVKFIK